MGANWGQLGPMLIKATWGHSGPSECNYMGPNRASLGQIGELGANSVPDLLIKSQLGPFIPA